MGPGSPQTLVTTRATLCPPKPNELLMPAIWPPGRARGKSLTRSRTISGSGRSTLIVGGAGAVETIFTVLALQQRTAPPTINVDRPDPEMVLDLVRDIPRALPSGQIAGINNSFGFGGHNVALVVTSV